MTVPPAPYLLALHMEGRLALVVGAGRVGRRKAAGLLAAGARVRLVDPRGAGELGERPGLECRMRPFVADDLAGAAVAIAATNDPRVNQQVAAAARHRGIWVSRADCPEEGDFTLPACLQRGRLSLAVSTAGGYAGFAAALRDRLAGQWGEEWGALTAIAVALRAHWLTREQWDEYNPQVLGLVLAVPFVEAVAARNWRDVDRLLAAAFGPGISLATLGLTSLTDPT